MNDKNVQNSQRKHKIYKANERVESRQTVIQFQMNETQNCSQRHVALTLWIYEEWASAIQINCDCCQRLMRQNALLD